MKRYLKLKVKCVKGRFKIQKKKNLTKKLPYCTWYCTRFRTLARNLTNTIWITTRGILKNGMNGEWIHKI